jgi:hypothetical protein
LTDPKSRRLRQGLTTVTTTSRTAQGTGESLTHEEERVVRMLNGMGESGDSELTFVESSDTEVNARLKLMEAKLLAMMHGQGPFAETATANSPKQKILNRLKALEEE